MAYLLSGEVFATSIRSALLASYTLLLSYYYPTAPPRNSAMGMVSGFARVGSILAPFIVMAGETVPGVQVKPTFIWTKTAFPVLTLAVLPQFLVLL